MSFAYQRPAEGGLVLHANGKLVVQIPESGEFAMLRDGDVLHKHGEAGLVKADATSMTAMLDAVGGDISDLEVLSIPVAEIDEAVLAEINKCLAIADYVGRLGADFRVEEAGLTC